MRFMKKVLALAFIACSILCIIKIVSLWSMFRKAQQNAATIDPWIQKHWNHVKIITEKSHSFSIKTILLWTKFFGTTNFVPPFSKLGCASPKCYVTTNRTYLNNSNALVFHLRDLDLKDMPAFRKPNQIWILLNHESPPHTPDDILRKVNNVFNWTATYRYDSEILLSPTFIKRNQTLTEVTRVNKKKPRLVAWLVSNCKTPSNRESFVKALQKALPVDIYGTCGLFSCVPKMSDECYAKLSHIYRFYLSFENSICKDYVTEKFFRILETDMVPVVMGGANYSTLAPPNSFIDALAFQTPKALATYLLRVAKDEVMYKSFFEWKKSYQMVYLHYICQICQKLNKPMIIPSTYTNISKWWFQDANCRSWA